MTNARFCIIPARALGDKRLNRTDIMVLNSLGMFGDREGWSFPSLTTIAEMIDAHKVSVSKAIAKLVECGYVEARPRYREDGSQTSNEYRILFDQASLFDHQRNAPTLPAADPLPPVSESANPPLASEAMGGLAQPLTLMNDPTLTTQVKEELSPKNKKREDYPGEFEEFWNAWPKQRRCEKPEAHKAWRRACEKIAHADLMQCVRRYLASPEAKPDRSGNIFVPYPAKWLKRERWVEFPASEAEKEIIIGELGGNPQEKQFLTELHSRLREKHGDAVYRSWFMPSLRSVSTQGKQIIFTVPTRFMAEWLRNHYSCEIEYFARQLWQHVESVSFAPANAKIATP